MDPGRPHAITILGRDLVLWRDQQGDWRAFEDLCPHRLAPLSGAASPPHWSCAGKAAIETRSAQRDRASAPILPVSGLRPCTLFAAYGSCCHMVSREPAHRQSEGGAMSESSRRSTGFCWAVWLCSMVVAVLNTSSELDSEGCSAAEGRLEADGTLACSYHGWRFGPDGKCTTIPQATDKKAEQTACASSRSAATTYPVQVCFRGSSAALDGCNE
jgi:nitrite reductase/ring-hydroxylating ferredoxin subunit